ncbi:hypothetical protein SAVIM338S_05812 [Streptomyces avidinii]
MAGDGDLEVSPAAVKNIRDGLRAAIGELRESGDAAGASMGAGFENLSMTGMEAGHAGLATDFEDLCERWEWGVRSRSRRAARTSRRPGRTRGDQLTSSGKIGSLKDLLEQAKRDGGGR